MSGKLLSFDRVFSAAMVLFVLSYFAYDYFNDSNKDQVTLQSSSKQNTTIDKPILVKKNVKKSKAQINSKGDLGNDIVAFGSELLGTPYVEAGCSRDGFDCSGFVYFVYQHHNIQVPRSSAQFENFGVEIPIHDVQKGDLLLFLSPTRNVIGHMGIVSNPKGRDSDFLHSTSGKEMQVVITNLSNSGYAQRFVKAIRVL